MFKLAKLRSVFVDLYGPHFSSTVDLPITTSCILQMKKVVATE